MSGAGRDRKPGWPSKLATVGVSTALLLLALEGAARWARSRPRLGRQGERKQYTRFDPVLGWSKVPGGGVTYRRDEYTVEVRINSLGLRDPERGYETPPGVFRVLALGDSFVEAYTVPLERAATQVLERRLVASGCPAQVINGGTGGYSTDQEYLFYREEGVRYSPRVVLLFVYYNDIFFNAVRNYFGTRKPILRMRGDRLVAVNVPLDPPRVRRARKRNRDAGRVSVPKGSALYAWVANRTMRGAPRTYEALSRSGLWPPLKIGKPSKTLMAYRLQRTSALRLGWSVTEHVLRALASDVEARGGRLLVVYVPSAMEVVDHVWDLTRIGYGLEEEQWDRGRVARRLQQIAERVGVALLDLTANLRRATARPFSPTYLERDGHWNAAGHRAAALSIETFLRERGWLSECMPETR